MDEAHERLRQEVEAAKAALVQNFVPEHARAAAMLASVAEVAAACVRHHEWHHEAERAEKAGEIGALMEEAELTERKAVVAWLRVRGLGKLAELVERKAHWG